MVLSGCLWKVFVMREVMFESTILFSLHRGFGFYGRETSCFSKPYVLNHIVFYVVCFPFHIQKLHPFLEVWMTLLMRNSTDRRPKTCMLSSVSCNQYKTSVSRICLYICVFNR